MFRFLRIERPMTQTLRPVSTATSTACCMRWTFEAKLATRIAPLAHRDDLAERLADEPLRAGDAGPLRVRRVAEHEVDAAVPDLGELARRRCADRPRACGRACSRSCAAPAGLPPRARSRRCPGPSAPSARTRRGTSRSGRRRPPGAASRSSVACRSPCSSSFDWSRPSVSRVPQTSGTLDLAHQVRQPADVVLVRMREQHRAHLVRAVAQVREVREDEIDAEMLVAREREARRRRRRSRRRARRPSGSCRPLPGPRAG